MTVMATALIAAPACMPLRLFGQGSAMTRNDGPPTRDPFTPGFVPKKELPDGRVPSPNEDGNFVIGPTHPPAPEMTVQDGAPRGVVHTFTMRSEDSRIYPGIARDSGTFGTVSPTDPAKLLVVFVATTAEPLKVDDPHG